MPGPSLSRALRTAEAGPAGAGADVTQDMALIRDALGRMETTIREERDTLDRLRRALGEMARAVARAKIEHKSEHKTEQAAAPAPEGGAPAALLDALERHIDAMLEIAGGGSVLTAAQAIDPDRVPTVSGVVSRLDPAADAQGQDLSPAADGALPDRSDAPAETAGQGSQDVPTVSMLKAMVEALNAAGSSETAQNAQAETAQDAYQDAHAETGDAAPSAPAEPDESAPDRPQTDDVPHDPLAPLRAMSEDERIALFS